MNKETMLKGAGYILVIILIANLILFAFRIIKGIIFWIIIMGMALWAYVLLPNIKKKFIPS